MAYFHRHRRRFISALHTSIRAFSARTRIDRRRRLLAADPELRHDHVQPCRSPRAGAKDHQPRKIHFLPRLDLHRVCDSVCDCRAGGVPVCADGVELLPEHHGGIGAVLHDPAACGHYRPWERQDFIEECGFDSVLSLFWQNPKAEVFV